MSGGSGLRGRLPGRLPARKPQAKGAAELSVVVTVGAMLAGVFFGQGLSRTAVDVADGLTWLSDDPSGEVIQVNPATGRPQYRLDVGEPGEDLDVAQYDGRLFVMNHTTGQLMSFDLTSILISGQRRVTGGGAVHTLAHDGSYYLVDSEQSTIAAVDPVTTDSLGEIWLSSVGLADAGIDGTGTVWALEDDGELHELRWSQSRQEFDTADTHTIELSGEGSVLVAHDEGATVFGPDQGIVAQVDTPDEVVADAAKLSGSLLAPEASPAGLVPVAAPETGTVVIVTPEGVREVDLTAIDCDTPGTPEVFRDIVYVPCQGASKVVRLDRDGARAGVDIETPGATTPELVLDDDNLIINAPGAETGVVVNDDGSTETIVRYDDEIPTTTPTTVDTAQPPPPDILDEILDNDPEPDNPAGPNQTQIGGDPGDPDDGGTGSSGVRDPDGNGGGNAGGQCDGKRKKRGQCPDGGAGQIEGDPSDPVDPVDPVAPPTDPVVGEPVDALEAPTNVRAVALSEGQVQVTWDHTTTPEPNDFVITSSPGRFNVSVKGTARQAVINIPVGSSASFTVTARTQLPPAEQTSAPSNTVSTSGRPGPPGSVGGSGDYPGGGDRFVVTVNWAAAADNGSAVTAYTLSVTTKDGTRTTTTDGSGRSATVEWTCDRGADPSCTVGGDWNATVTATNAVGAGPGGTGSGAAPPAPPPPPPPLPPAGSTIVTGHDHTWTGSSLEGMGETILYLNPPPAWAGFGGACSWSYSGGSGGQQSGPIACDAGSLTISIDNGIIRDPESGDVEHSVVFTAANAGGSVDSATYWWTTSQQTLCRKCQIP